MEHTVKKNKMAVMPIKRLMLSMSIPMILSMVLQAVYNIVDSAFVSNMKENGEAALNALTLVFPVQMLMVAVGIGTGVGVNVLVAKSLGQNDRERASRAMGNGIFMALMISVVWILFGLFGAELYIHTQTENALIASLAVEYLQICCTISFGISFFSIYEKLLQATGHSGCSTLAQIAGAVTNMILDPILIYGWLGAPEMGVKGAAYATVIGQIVSFLIALLLHLKVNKSLSNKLCYFKPSGSMIRAIYVIGFPAIIAQALMSVMTYGLNIILVGISESMVTAYGLYYKVQQFVLFAAFGLRDAITPIVSFNYGMGSRQRIQESIKYGMLFTLLLMLAGLLILEIFAVPFSNLFGLSGDTQALCIRAMQIVSVSFLFAGANIAFQGIFQALDGGMESLIVSVCRQLLLIFPLVILFAHFAKADSSLTWLVWTAFPIAEGLSVIVACFLFQRIYKKRMNCFSDAPTAG